jgi:hypothetical protein
VVAPPLGFPPVIVPAPNAAAVARAEIVWGRWKKQHHSKAIQQMIRSNKETQFFKYNDHLNTIEPYYRRENILRSVRSRHGRGKKGVFRHEEIHQLAQQHPAHEAHKQSKAAFEKKDPFSTNSKYAEAASIGEYIKLELLPAIIYVTIKKNVQVHAVRILSRQLFLHCGKTDTRIQLKQSQRTGKYTYNVWLRTKQLKTMSEDEFFKKLMGVTKNGNRTVTLMVRQNIRKGSLHVLWENEHSLL